MKKCIAVLLLFSFTLSACSHVFVKYQEEPETNFYNKINRMTEGQVVSIELLSGQTIKGNDLVVRSDLISFWNKESNSQQKIETSTIRSIVFKEKERGAFEGFLYGTLIGGVIGLAPNLLFAKGAGHPSGNPLLLLYGALAGAAIGLIYGSSNESSTTFQLND